MIDGLYLCLKNGIGFMSFTINPNLIGKIIEIE